MLKFIRRNVLCATLLALMAVCAILVPVTAARADDRDYNAYWQNQAQITQQLQNGQTPYQGNTQDYNAYWQQQADIATAQARMP